MRSITETQVARHLTPARRPAQLAALREAFEHFAQGRATVLPRSRAALAQASGAPMVSAMGAVLPDMLGTKVYATLNGKFQFVVNLFDTTTGLPLATMSANELTRVRTAATTALAVDTLARAQARVLGVFGNGVQAQAHVEALLGVRRFERVMLHARSDAPGTAARWSAEFGLPVEAVDAARVAAESDVIVTCTRATEPLFDGALVRPGTLVCAVGSSKPVARELDDTLLARAAAVVVEWKTAALAEAGELVRAAPGTIAPERLKELGELLVAGHAPAAQDIVVYKSVGIGLEDIALAAMVLCDEAAAQAGSEQPS
ncbi:ornithine cyclodeaminase family protein [Roseateles aquatilis]|nr:ornithine cyclodeaminase family protein [Roseateles aquatilis]